MSQTYLVDLMYAYFMCHPHSIGIGTHRQRGIIEHAQNIYYLWRDRSHDRNRIKRVSIATEEELIEFRRTLSRLTCGGYYERSARNEVRLFTRQLAVPFPARSQA